MFKLLPDAPVRWSDVWLGALLTALLFALGNFLVGLYLGHSNLTSVFGAGSSLAVILVWIYYAAMVVLFGAKFTFVWSQRREKAASDATTTAGAADDRPRDTSRPRA
jgi:membrane protein